MLPVHECERRHHDPRRLHMAEPLLRIGSLDAIAPTFERGRCHMLPSDGDERYRGKATQLLLGLHSGNRCDFHNLCLHGQFKPRGRAALDQVMPRTLHQWEA